VNVSKDILKDQSLSLRDRGMLVTILSLSDNWDFNVRGFSKILPDGVDCIRSSVNELIKRGYLTGGQERTGNGRFGKNVIEVHQVPVPPRLKNPITVNPFTEISNTVGSITDIPHAENPTQVINNKVNSNRANNHQSICKRNDGESDIMTTISRQLVSMQELIENFRYSELCQILSYQHLLQECKECQLSQFEIKERVIEELKYLIKYETLVLDGYGSMADALLDYMSEIIAVSIGASTYLHNLCVVLWRMIGKFRKSGTHFRTGSSLWAVPKLARGLCPLDPQQGFHPLHSSAADALV